MAGCAASAAGLPRAFSGSRTKRHGYLIFAVLAVALSAVWRWTARAWLEIESPRNKAFKQLCKLGQRKGREVARRFIGEGEKFLAMKPRTVFVRRSRWLADAESIEATVAEGREQGPASLLPAAPLHWGGGVRADDGRATSPASLCVLPNDLFDKVTTQEASQGVLCVFPTPPKPAADTDARSLLGDFVVVADCIEDPNNLGVILRTMEAFGATSLVSMKGTVDVFNDKVVRCSMGAVVRGRIRFLEAEDAAALRRLLKHHRIFATTLGGTLQVSGLQARLARHGNAFVMGNEARGVSLEVQEVADELVKIPMVPGVDSLNVGVAAGIILHAAARDVDGHELPRKEGGQGA